MSYVPTAPGAGLNARATREIGQPLASAAGWMKFIGIMFIIQGVLTALTLVGILIAWLPIWIGVLLLQSAGAAQRSHLQDDANALIESLSRLKTYFVIQGVLYLVGIALVVLYFMFFGAVLVAMLHGNLGH
jgi:hypothetical protein